MPHRLRRRVRRRSYLILAEDMSKVDAKLHVRQTSTHIIGPAQSNGTILSRKEGQHSLQAYARARARGEWEEVKFHRHGRLQPPFWNKVLRLRKHIWVAVIGVCLHADYSTFGDRVAANLQAVLRSNSLQEGWDRRVNSEAFTADAV